MNIGISIKKLRLQKGLTQEDLAEYLNVSVQTISRWETNVNYPDLTIIPLLANLFDVTTDYLLGVDILQKEKRISEILEEDKKLNNLGKNEERINLLKKAVKDYPSNFKLKEKLASALLLYFGNKDEERNDLLPEIISLSEKILEKCTDDEIRHSTIQVLCFAYNYNGEKEKAKALANTMSSIWVTKDILLENILEGDEKIKQQQDNILKCLEIFHGISITYNRGKIESLKRIELLDKYIQMVKLLLGEDQYNFYNIRVYDNYRYMAKEYGKLMDKENCIRCIKESLKYANKYEQRPEVGNYSVWWLDKLTCNKSDTLTNSDKNIFESSFEFYNSKVFDFIRDDKDFQAIFISTKEADSIV